MPAKKSIAKEIKEITSKKAHAIKILEQRDFLDTENFINSIYQLESHPLLVSKAPLKDRLEKANEILMSILKSDESIKVETEEEDKDQEEEQEDKEASDEEEEIIEEEPARERRKSEETQGSKTGSEEALIKMTLTPTTPKTGAVIQAQQETEEHRQSVALAGNVDFDEKTQSAYKKQGWLPQDAQASVVTSAAHFHSMGVGGENLREAAKESNLSTTAKDYFFETATVIDYLDVADEALSGKLKLAAQNPSVKIESSSQQPPPSFQVNQFFLEVKDKIISPIIDPIRDKVIGELKEKGVKRLTKRSIQQLSKQAKKKVKKLAKKAIKKGAKMIAKQAAKTAAKVGLKTTIRVGLAAITESVNAAIPGLGVVLHIVAEFLVWAVDKTIGALWRWAKENKEVVLIGGLMAAGAVFGQPMMFLAGIGIGAAFFVANVISLALRVVLLLLAGLFVTVITVTVVQFIINSGAYIVPPGGPGPLIPGVPVYNPYVQVEKLASSTNPSRPPAASQIYDNAHLPLEVTYEITITALLETLSNITFNETCEVHQESSPPQNCVAPNPAIPAPPGVIETIAPFTFTYTRTFPNNSDYRDSLVVDTFTITADVAGGNTTYSTSASICIGDCPQECPSIWPMSGGLYVTQGPLGGTSHGQVEAIDIGGGTYGLPVVSTHGGTVAAINTSTAGPYGMYIDIAGVCNGENFVSRYSHMLDFPLGLDVGVSVNMGQQVGISDTTGTGAAHLHYEFRRCTPGGCAYTCGPGYSGPMPCMKTPYIPTTVDPIYCNSSSECGISIP